MAQMAALVEKMAAMQVEIDTQKLQWRGIGKAKGEDSLEYTPPATAVQRLFASGAAAADDASPASIPASFFLTPQRGQAAAAANAKDAAPMSKDLHYPPADGRGQKQWGSQAAWNEASASLGGPGASWTQQGWVDYGGGVAPPLQNPPGFADPLANPLLDPWNRSAQIGEKHADEAE